MSVRRKLEKFSMSADTLTVKSRGFYEFTRFKLIASLLLGACIMLCLGLCSSAGGEAQARNSVLEHQTFNDDHIEDGTNAAAVGYGMCEN